MLIATTVLVVAACAPAAPTADRSAGGQPTGSVPAATDPGPSTTSVTTPLPAGPFPVTTSTRTFVDATRPTEAGSETPARPDRTLETTIVRPDAPGPFPLIVFSHGLAGHPDKFTQLLGAWARAGFVVAAPAFPLTNDRTPGRSANWAGLAAQPADVSFVITKLLAANADPDDPLHDAIIPERIGAGGLSLGGATTYAVTFNDCCRDDRIRAAEVLSGARLAVGGTYDLDGHVPLLIMHGDHDASLPYSYEVTSFAEAKGPVWFVTLHGGTHAPPFEDTPSPWDELDERTTTDFWLGTLAADPTALARVTADATVDGLSSIESK